MWNQIRGREMPRMLSPAIRLRVQRLDDIGEVIVKLIQIFVVIVATLLYIATPHPADVTMFASPTPYVLGLYLVLSTLGLLWALRPPVPAFAVYLSILLDFLLLYGLIWSTHIQYAQPPSFVMKSPTLLYVFLFIAIRTLRFEIRYVLAAGAAAAAGWLALLAWVLATEPSSEVLTRNYVNYLTSNSVLLWAEIDKIVLIVLVTGVLTLALTLARNLLVASVTEAQAAVNLARFFDPAVADDIRAFESGLAPGHGTQREASIMFVDLRGFTGLAAEHPPSDVLAALASFQKAVVPIIRDHGGTIDKFLGDGIMATFGAVRPLSTHAANALMATEAVLDAFARDVAARHAWFAEDGIGIAVVAGRVVSGVVGVEGRLEFTVIGSAVNLCAKLEKHNKEIGTLALTTRETLDLARSQGLKPRGRVPSLSVLLPGTADSVEIAILRSRRKGMIRTIRHRLARAARLPG
ncbi:adenylate/guanylate cyclase domain-containing protein [Aureimonas endophytica]|uniref:adenylate/guanylate cyclase domain-containing protein n=1 Tax=Aureimonas endophytica TaxID=2027858 RepID=UPI0016655122|nr:adenylate/guanylate cyclase domain-containing protein [Aureimonas endophytica]